MERTVCSTLVLMVLKIIRTVVSFILLQREESRMTSIHATLLGLKNLFAWHVVSISFVLESLRYTKNMIIFLLFSVTRFLAIKNETVNLLSIGKIPVLCLAFLQVSSVSGVLPHYTADSAMSIFRDRNEGFINPVLKELGYKLLVLLKCFKIIPI